MSDSVGGLPEQQSPKAARLQDLIQKLTDDPELARPSRFCPAMLEIATGRPLVAALQRHDHDLLGILAAHPRSVGLHEALGPSAVLRATLTIWRRHGLARDDWDLADQTFALGALITGCALALVGSAPEPAMPDDPMIVLAAAITALLGPEHANRQDITSAAADIVQFLREGRAAALRLIDPPGGNR